MSDSIKIFHITDIHLGTSIGKNRPVPGAAVTFPQSVYDTLRALDQVILDIEEQQPDAILITGDTFHHVIHSRYLLTALTTRIAKMTRVAPTIMIVGNHDIIAGTHMLADYAALPVHNLHIVSSTRVVEIKARNGQMMSFVCAAWPITTMIGDEQVENDLSNEKQKNKQEFHHIINTFAHDSLEMIPDSHYKVFVGHGTVLGVYNGDQLHYIRKGESVKDDVVLYPKNLLGYDYVAMGHIHIRALADDKICYPGSLCVVDFSESDLPHGFAVVEIDQNRMPIITFREVFTRPFSNVLVRTDQFSDEQSIINFILQEAPPDEDRFTRVKLMVNSKGIDVSIPMLYEVLEDHYAYLTVDRQYLDADEAKNEVPTFQPGETTISVVKRYLDTRDDLQDEQKVMALIRLRALINQG